MTIPSLCTDVSNSKYMKNSLEGSQCERGSQNDLLSASAILKSQGHFIKPASYIIVTTKHLSTRHPENSFPLPL